ncbi:TlpA family protein disulfide reductase [Catalinimonas sp. 4WD22]|uniref:TlpA family protein disulfide reductase n=1 Tax=Catalinimonas locisalis TaxID=3133978 RepID=UPI003101785A
MPGILYTSLILVLTLSSAQIVFSQPQPSVNGESAQHFSRPIYLYTDKYPSFDVLMQEFSGNLVYIDIWASWCKPCLEEFAYYEEVKKVIEDEPIKLLFISIDRSKHMHRWKRRIEKYALSGYHLIASSALQKDMWELIQQQENRVEIPRYLIVDKNGEIVNKQAARPSQPDALKIAIEEVLRFER